MKNPVPLTKAINPVKDSIRRPPLRPGLPRKQQLPRTQAMWIIRGFVLIPLALALASFALSPAARAVDPPPDGGYPGHCTAEGEQALFNNGGGGSKNTAIGARALYSNVGGRQNTAIGWQALLSSGGSFNTATGSEALINNTGGSLNTANGFGALSSNTTGKKNIALGNHAGVNLTTGDNNIDIGNQGVADEDNTIRIGYGQKNTFIAGISGTAIVGDTVAVDSNGQLGVIVSSARFKDAIKPMDKASEAILALQPVTFRYKHELDPKGIPQFGLVAEQVEKVNPNLVARDEHGKPYRVRYEAVNAMLLNEFLKEHRKVQEQQATIIQLKSAVAHQQKDFQATTAQQQKQIKALTAGLQKVSAQVEMSKPASQMVLNDQ